MWDLNSVYFVSDGRFCNKEWPHSIIIDVNQLDQFTLSYQLLLSEI